MVWSGFRPQIILRTYKYDIPGLVSQSFPILLTPYTIYSPGVVVVPYLRQKVERMFLLVREELADSQAGKYQKIKKIFVQLYPFLHLLLDSLDICKTFQCFNILLRSTLLSGFLLRFSLSEEGKHHSLLSYLIGIEEITLLLKIFIVLHSGFHLVSLTPERMSEKSRRIYQNENSKKNTF